MGLSTSLYTGVSGLNATGNDLSVIGNDLSNSNTVGYKGGVSTFADILSSSLSGGSQIGRGVQLMGVSTDFTQGTLESTSNPLDLAISGDGFFVVKTASGAQYYTRAGQFSLNKDGNIIDPNGDLLQGYLTLTGGGQLGTINVSSLNSSPNPTSKVTITSQLNSAQGVTNGLFSADPTTTSGTDFTIDSTNDIIFINGNKITIPSGTYTGATLGSTLQGLIDTYSQTASVTYNTTGTDVYKFSINDNAGFVINANNNQINFTDNTTGQSYTASVATGTYATGAALAAAVQVAFHSEDPAAFPNATPVNFVAGLPGHLNIPSTNSVIINWGSSSTTAIPQEFGFTSASTSIAGGTSANGTAIGSAPLTIDWANAASTSGNMFGFSSNGGITIDASSNTINFTDAGSGTTFTATIPAATYTNGTALAAAMQTALNAQDPVFTVKYDTTKNEMSISNTSANTITVHWAAGSVVNDPADNAGQLGLFAYTGGTDTAILANSTATATTSPTSTGLSVGGTSTSSYAVAGMDPNNGSSTADFSTSITVYDSLGNSHLVNVYFKKVAQSESLLNPSGSSTQGNRWLYWAVTPSTDSVNGQSAISAQGMLEFNTAGALVYDNGGNADYSSFNFTGGVDQNQSIAFNFGKAIAQSGSGLTGTTQFGSSNSVSFQDQDGYSSGTLESLSVDQNGGMSGTFTNGQTVKVADVALARFIAPTDLTKVGGNLYGESSGSGSAIIGNAGTSGRGTISSSSLEASNVDMAAEFVKMIAAQQAFQANAKVISGTNTLLTALQDVMH